MKFTTPHGVGETMGDQKQARNCYVTSFKRREVMSSESQDTRNDLQQQRATLVEDLTLVLLDEVEPSRTVQVGSIFGGDHKALLVDFLKDNNDVFAWSAADVLGIDLVVITHRLGVAPSHQPVRQKRRSFTLERQMFIAEEVSKLLEAHFI